MMDRKKMWSVAAALAVCAIFSLVLYVRSTRVRIQGEFYYADTVQLDLSGRPLEDVESLLRLQRLRWLDIRGTGISNGACRRLQNGLPECRILWDPVFQGKAYPAETKSLSATELSAQDLTDLACFPELTSLDVTQCRDYDRILEAVTLLPGCEVSYRVFIGSHAYGPETVSIVLQDGIPAEAEAVLPYLPELRQLHFSGRTPPKTELEALRRRWPSLDITWDFVFHGQTVTHRTTRLDLSDIPLNDPAEIAALLSRMHGILTVDLCGTGLSRDEIMALAADFPRVTFILEIPIGSATVRTDAREIDISGIPVTVAEIEALLPSLPNLRKVVMIDCGNTNEEMAALNRRYGHIQFVWAVSVGDGKFARTDITGFIPYKYHLDQYVMTQQDADNLRYCTQLIALDLGHQSITSCEFLAYMPELKYVILSDTCISDISPLAGNTNVVFLEVFDTYLWDLEPLLTLTGLQDLNICWCPADYRVVAQMFWLERCWWGGNQHTQEQMGYLQTQCPNTLFEFRADYSTGFGWRKGPLYFQMRDALDMFYQ